MRRYNQIIGFATQAIAPGQHVHTHNLAFSTFERAHEVGAGVHPTAYVDEPATFMGIVRDDGRIATRNYIGVLTSVNCSATAARAIADQFRRDIHPEALADYPNVDGVVALTHGQAAPPPATAKSCWCCAARWAATPSTPTSRPCWWSGSAARPTRSRG